MLSRRLQRRIALCLLAGVASTILVATVLALWERGSHWWDRGVVSTSMVEGGGVWLVSQARRIGQTTVTVIGTPNAEAGQFAIDNVRSLIRASTGDGGPHYIDNLPRPAWATLPVDLLPQVAPRERLIQMHYAGGWPWRALRCRGTMGLLLPPGTWSWEGCLLVGDMPLPYNPIWSGLLFDIAAHALFWLTAWTGLLQVRARRRRGRGLCPSCAYNLAGLTSGACPECGATVVRPPTAV